MDLTLENHLTELWSEILNCNLCKMPKNCKPHFRPVGKLYEIGGVAFLQINPGIAGFISKSDIDEKYKSDRTKEIALKKQRSTEEINLYLNNFQNNPCKDSWERMSDAFLSAMKESWGWPPGKYRKTIERHLEKTEVSFNSLAFLNLMQCPVKGNKYNNKYISKCWSKNTIELLRTLKPRVIIAQGRKAYSFLINQSDDFFKNVKILEGVHHASRKKTEYNQKIFDRVSKYINDIRN